MTIKIINKRILDKRGIFITYRANISPTEDYDKVVEVLEKFVNHTMRNIIKYAHTDIPYLLNVTYNYEHGYIEFDVQQKYYNSKFLMQAYTYHFNDMYYIFAKYSDTPNPDKPEEILIPEEEYDFYLRYSV